MSVAKFSVCSGKPGTHWRQSWIQQGRLCWKSTVAETDNKLRPLPYALNFVADTFNFVADFGNKPATTWIQQFAAVDFVADTFNFTLIRSTLFPLYGAKATRPTLSTFCKVDRVEFNFVTSVYQALHVQSL